MLKFQPLKNPAVVPGLCLRIPQADSYIRITHTFATCAYIMWVKGAEGARYARRPTRLGLSKLAELSSERGACWGILSLGSSQSDVPPAGSKRSLKLDASYELIKPLIKLFESEKNLSRHKFNKLIGDHADSTGAPLITVRRLVLRYYYFGLSKSGLLPLTPGPEPQKRSSRLSSAAKEPNKSYGPKRRGRQSIQTKKPRSGNSGSSGPQHKKKYPPNDFIPQTIDIVDMTNCLKRLLKRGKTCISDAHEEYLAQEFRKRHPEIHREYMAGLRVAPVSERQFRYYINKFVELEEALEQNLNRYKRNRGYAGVHRSTGPADVYELDATGGRFFLVARGDPPILLGTPTIYIMIDRASRYVPAIYLTLRKASFEEVRYVMLISFTSRDWLRSLDIDVDDEQFPPGRPCAELCLDRGPELASLAMDEAAAEGLRIPVTSLPSRNPDAKAIVERFIRELKRKMANTRLKGIFVQRPTDHDTRAQRNKAARVAVHTLKEAYAVLIEIVNDYNNSPHKALRRNKLLIQAGVPPTPKAAYLWGLDNITALKATKLTNEDFQKALLGFDHATISNGVVRYRDRVYDTANEAAARYCEKFARRARSFDIRIHRPAFHEFFVPMPHGEWAHFVISPGGAAEVRGVTLDEEDALEETELLLTQNAAEDAKRNRVAKKVERSGSPSRRTQAPIRVDHQTQTALQNRETQHIKDVIAGQASAISRSSGVPRKKQVKSEGWRSLEENEQTRHLDEVQSRRRSA